MQFLTNPFSVKAWLHKQGPHVVVYQVCNSETSYALIYLANPTFTAMEQVILTVFVCDQCRVRQSVFLYRVSDYLYLWNVCNSCFSKDHPSICFPGERLDPF